jgi:hypothetical protein
MTGVPVVAPLFRDPIYDGAADPVLVANVAERTWWMIYTSRRANAPEGRGAAWAHGTSLGVASSSDGGASWLYRGTIDGLGLGWGRETYWAPEVVDVEGTYHMFVTVIPGIPSTWEGHPRHIRHYTSPDLIAWSYQSTLELSSDRVIDACVHPLPTGGYRLWYKDEADDAQTWFADSADLHTWTVQGRAFEGRPHEGPNVFALGGTYWMLVDEWRGQRVLRSDDLVRWERQGLLLDQPGRRPDDNSVGLHADVVIDGDQASIFYFTHPGRDSRGLADQMQHAGRRTSIQVARLRTEDGTLRCDRNQALFGPVLPILRP